MAQPRELGSANSRSIEINHVTFLWRYTDELVQCQLRVPTLGWVAAGFNNSKALDNTWFVIGHVSNPVARVEEHIAMPPIHRTVQSLGLPPAIVESSGQYSAGYSQMNFAMPQRIPGRPQLDLQRGSSVYLMLAWSHESDFEHHSAWRKHIAITL